MCIYAYVCVLAISKNTFNVYIDNVYIHGTTPILPLLLELTERYGHCESAIFSGSVGFHI